ncbi:deaminase [Kribbella sindirgiensis]|uniref:Deaminase n=2 Tax=Kribbella sindirgiensis TaxID=1124744 RepID=A0A4R0HYM3_9ACTN|nr:deaminase [Kribbella sindirgiensis]
MSMRPYVILSVAASVDGYIDDSNPERLYLSNEADFDRVDEVRAGVDAVLIGANTVRRDNPRLRIRSQDRRDRRVAAGRPEIPLKVTISSKGDLDPASKFFGTEDVEKLVYVPTSAKSAAGERLGEVATVVGAGDPLDLRSVLTDLSSRGVGRLMVEGGGHIHTMFLTAELVDEIHLAVAPFFVGDSTAPRLVVDAKFPQDFRNRMHLDEVQQIGDIALLRYLLKEPSDA